MNMIFKLEHTHETKALKSLKTQAIKARPQVRQNTYRERRQQT